MKLNKRTGAVLGFLLAAGSATAATGWLTNYTWTYDTLRKEPQPVVMVTDDDDGTWTTVKTGTGLAGDVSGSVVDLGDIGPAATAAKQDTIISALGSSRACTTLKLKSDTVAVTDSAKNVDAGATGTTYWTAVKNLSRSFDIEVGFGASVGTFRVDPGGSYTASLAGATTPDNATFNNTCTGCGGAATYVSLAACDD